MSNTPYFETLTEAIDSVQLVLDTHEAVVLDGAINTMEGPIWYVELGRVPVNYGDTLRKRFEIFTIKGKHTKKFLHVQIYRMPSGRYEVNAYIL